MASVGQSDGSNTMESPGTDGSGTGVPNNSVISNFTNLANAVAVDISGTFRAINAPAGTQGSGFQIGAAPGQAGVLGIGLIPILLIGLAAWLIFK